MRRRAADEAGGQGGLLDGKRAPQTAGDLVELVSHTWSTS
jgi:hypothetical protein